MFEHRLKQEAVKEAFNSEQIREDFLNSSSYFRKPSIIVEELLFKRRLFTFRDTRRD